MHGKMYHLLRGRGRVWGKVQGKDEQADRLVPAWSQSTQNMFYFGFREGRILEMKKDIETIFKNEK